MMKINSLRTCICVVFRWGVCKSNGWYIRPFKVRMIYTLEGDTKGRPSHLEYHLDRIPRRLANQFAASSFVVLEHAGLF